MANRRGKQKAKLQELKERAARILDRLEQEHPDARIYLDYNGPWQLLIATILAAQCTDEKVNQVTPELFERWPTPQDLAEADQQQVQQIIRPTGTFRRKQQAIQRVSRILVEKYDGQVPNDLDALTDIKGVGRKTASIVLAQAYGANAIGVDTHVERVTKRLGLAWHKTVNAVEKDLRAVIAEERLGRATELLTTHGRRVCTASKPDHAHCCVKDLCDYYLEQVQG